MKNKKNRRKPFDFYWETRNKSFLFKVTKREARSWFNLGRTEEYKHMSQPIEDRLKETAP